MKKDKVLGVVQLLGYSYDDFWYVMPLMKCSEEYVASKIKKDINKIVSMFIPLVETFAYLHSLKIYHRDIKPSNIYVHNNSMIIGDFGLVDFPDKNENITESDRPLGAIFTMAPEMRRNPTIADGEKADVYSLAKTLWMFLTGEYKGFEGQYSVLDETNRLRKYNEYIGVHLVEIEILLTQATSNAPELRPNMSAFLNSLKEWQEVSQDRSRSQKVDWDFLTKIIFGNLVPQTASFVNANDIYIILSAISNSPAANHMFFAGKGGTDLVNVEKAPEKDCFALIVQPYERIIIKPKCLYYYSFDDIRWNFFLIELVDLAPVVGDNCTQYREEVTEDYPGHYVSSLDSIYGVYDYDSGEPLPPGHRTVSRCLHEKLLITMKIGPYNHIQSVYDGRHGNCSSDAFYKYLCRLSSIFKKIKMEVSSDEEAMDILSNYVAKNQFPSPQKGTMHIEEKPFATKHIRYNFRHWNFLECLHLLYKQSADESVQYYFILKQISHCYDLSINKTKEENQLSGTSIDNELFIMRDGILCDICTRNISQNRNLFYVTNAQDALSINKVLNKKLHELCIGYSLDNVLESISFNILFLRSRKPRHLFTKEELVTKMRNADDRINNRLVINGDGELLIIPGEEDTSVYPVSHEMYLARNNYVGKYSPNTHIEDVYYYLREAWLSHLKTGKRQFVSDYLNPKNEEKLEHDLYLFYNAPETI